MQYHATLTDETGCEFGHTFHANNRREAWDKIDELFPESQCVQLEDRDDTQKREQQAYDRMAEEIDNDW